jgi:hypothetical protein
VTEFDLTDYVAIGARAFVDTQTAYNWDKLDEMAQHSFRELLLPVVSVVIAEYRKNHASSDLSFLEGIG